MAPRRSLRPPDPSARYAWLNTTCDPEFKRRVDALAIRKGISTSALLRLALTAYLKLPHKSAIPRARLRALELLLDPPARERGGSR